MSVLGSLSAAKVIVGLVVAGASALGGYNYATTGCPLRTTCDAGSGEVSTVALAGDDGCPIGCSMEKAPDPAAAVTLVSANAEKSESASCCELGEAAAVKDACDTDECCEDGTECCESGEGCSEDAKSAKGDDCCNSAAG